MSIKFLQHFKLLQGALWGGVIYLIARGLILILFYINNITRIGFLEILRVVLGVIGTPISLLSWIFGWWGDSEPAGILSNEFLVFLIELFAWMTIGALWGLVRLTHKRHRNTQKQG